MNTASFEKTARSGIPAAAFAGAMPGKRKDTPDRAGVCCRYAAGVCTSFQSRRMIRMLIIRNAAARITLHIMAGG